MTNCYIESPHCHLNRLNRNKTANGIVVRKHENVKESNSCEILLLKSRKKYSWCDEVYDYDGRSYYHKIAVGDSIVKEKGSLNMYVFRPDTFFVINLGFDCYLDITED